MASHAVRALVANGRRVTLAAAWPAVYGKVLKMLGQGRISVACTDSVKRTCLICGRMRNRVYVRPQDVVLISLRAGMTADDKADVVHKYTPEEARALRKRGDIPEKFLGEMNEDATVVEAAPDAGGGVEASADDAGEAFEFDEADIDDL